MAKIRSNMQVKMYYRIAKWIIIFVLLFAFGYWALGAGLLRPEKRTELRGRFCHQLCGHIQLNQTFSEEEFNACMKKCL